MNASSTHHNKPETNFDLQTAKGFPLVDPLPEANDQFVIYSAIEILNRLHGFPTGFLNRTHWKPQNPPLLSIERQAWDEHQLVPWTGSKPTWIDLVINNLDGTGHPFHLVSFSTLYLMKNTRGTLNNIQHGFKFFVISSYRGKGGWDFYNPFDLSRAPRGGPFNVINPLLKDTVYVPSFGYVVLRFRADNEGIWALHCHILWHQASGMTMAFQVLGDGKDGFKHAHIGAQAQRSCII